MKSFRNLEVLDRASAAVGEGPSWDAARDALVWVDITRGTVFLTGLGGDRLATFDVGGDVSAALPVEGGGWLLARQRGLSTLSEAGDLQSLLDLHPDTPEMRCNDAKCDPMGRAFVGTMPYQNVAGAATLYRVDHGPRATVIMDDLTLSNGLGWDASGAAFWFIDSATQSVRRYAYDIDTGEVNALLETIHIPARTGMPDGLCVDDEGCAWVGLWGGSAVQRYTPDGRLDAVVEVPASQVTSCAFGGPNGATLFITTATHQLSAERLASEPLAGALFATDVGVSGPAATPWRGTA